MQIEEAQTRCPLCGSAALDFFAVLHHLPCAYVGPAYDFTFPGTRDSCPKCRSAILGAALECEAVGTCARCRSCGAELAMAPPPTAPSIAPDDILPRHPERCPSDSVRVPRPGAV